MEGDREARIVFTMRDRRVMFRLTMPDPAAEVFHLTPSRGTRRAPEQAWAAWEQACRARWRALALVVKAKLEAVESGIVVFDDEFLAHIILPGSNGQTVGEMVRPKVAQAYVQNRMVPLLEGPRP